MGARPKIKTKADLYKKSSRENEMLKLAKEQESEKHLVAVRVDARTTKLVNVGECATKK